MGTNQSRWISDTCAALALAASMLGAQAAIAVPYTATYLGDGSSAVINNLGQVAVTTSSGAFLFSNGVKTDLGSLGGGGTQAVGINDFGQIVGTSRTSSGVVRSFLFGGGSMFSLAFADIQPVAINNARQVTGTYDLLGETHAFLLNPLGGVPLFRDLGTLSTCGFPYVPGGFCYADRTAFSTSSDINNLGQVVGTSAVEIAKVHTAFLYSNGVVQDLGTPINTFTADSEAIAIDDLGQVVGNTEGIPFIYSSGSMRVLHEILELAGPPLFPNDINNRGQVIGDSGHSSFLVTVGGGVEDINTLLVPGSGWELTRALHINDAGQIVGLGRRVGESGPGLAALLLSPVPEPSTYALMLAGLGLVAGLSRRRKCKVRPETSNQAHASASGCRSIS